MAGASRATRPRGTTGRHSGRIIVTAGHGDLAPAWQDQLAPGGRLVVPLRWRGQARSVPFTHEEDRLRSDSVQLCGFIPMIDQDGERTGHLDIDGHVALTVPATIGEQDERGEDADRPAGSILRPTATPAAAPGRYCGSWRARRR
ncbi:MAG: hypothetical protein ACRDSZ_16175 [Pseudonocardiaceae bacterium]